MQTVREHKEELIDTVIFDDFRKKRPRSGAIVIPQERAHVFNIDALEIENDILDLLLLETVAARSGLLACCSWGLEG